MTTRSLLAKGILGAVAGTAALLALSTGASAYIACNDRGDCWHTTVKVDYRDYPDVKVVYYDDAWDWKVRHFHWHEVNGDYGYWDSDKNAWVTVHPAQPGEPTPDDTH
jgi:hypothetical protein